MTRQQNLTYEQGTWFGVPLKQGGYALGLVARCGEAGEALGYFFGPPQAELPDLSLMSQNTADLAILCCRFGDLGLIEQKWPIIGRAPVWDPAIWPVPKFIRWVDTFIEGVGKIAFLSAYSEDLEFVSEERYSPTKDEHFPKDALYGSGAVEIALSECLSGDGTSNR